MWTCEKCGSDTRLMVNILITIPGDCEHKLTKKLLASKKAEIWSASWDSADAICQNPNCRYTELRRGNYVRNLEREVEALKAKIHLSEGCR